MLTLLHELSVRQVNMALLALDAEIKKTAAAADAQIAELEARVAALEEAAKKT